MQVADLQVIKDIPGFKVIFKAILKSQIQQMVTQLSEFTGEESVLLTASVSDGSFSHLGSESGKVFLDDNDEFKAQFLGFCLKRYHKQKQLQMADEMVNRPGAVSPRKFGPGSKIRATRPYTTSSPSNVIPQIEKIIGLKAPSTAPKIVRPSPYPAVRPQSSASSNRSLDSSSTSVEPTMDSEMKSGIHKDRPDVRVDVQTDNSGVKSGVQVDKPDVTSDVEVDKPGVASGVQVDKPGVTSGVQMDKTSVKIEPKDDSDETSQAMENTLSDSFNASPSPNEHSTPDVVKPGPSSTVSYSESESSFAKDDSNNESGSALEVDWSNMSKIAMENLHEEASKDIKFEGNLDMEMDIGLSGMGSGQAGVPMIENMMQNVPEGMALSPSVIAAVANSAPMKSAQASNHPGYPGAHPGIKDPAVYDKWAREHKKQGLARFLPESAIQVMKAWLFKNVMNPYPSEEEKRKMAVETKLNLVQINNWFTNARRRIIQPMLDSGKSEDAVSKLAKYATHNIPRPWTVFSSQATRQEAIQRIPLAPKSGGRMSNSYSEYQSMDQQSDPEDYSFI